LQCQMQHKDPQVIKNARRLYIGGIPDGTKEVCCDGAPASSSSITQSKSSAIALSTRDQGAARVQRGCC
jgi:hypothetical protein